MSGTIGSEQQLGTSAGAGMDMGVGAGAGTKQAAGYEVRAKTAARNLLDLLLLWASKAPQRVSIRYKVRGQWRDATWHEVTTQVRKLALGLTELGVEPGDRVAIFAATRFEWTLANLAIFGAGAVAVPIYASNTPQEVELILRDAGCKVLFVDHDVNEGRLPGRLTRVRQVQAQVPELAHVVGFDLASRPGEGLLGFAELEAQGAARLPAYPTALEERADSLGRDDLAFLIYTSGTTGMPKGVMLTQGNWTSQARSVDECHLIGHDDVVLLFLPLAHSFALVVVAAWLGSGMVLAFAESIERAVDNAAEVQATVMAVVPRVFEKAYNKVVSEGGAARGAKGRLFTWAMGLFEEYSAARAAGREYVNVPWAIAKRVVFAPIASKLDARFGGTLKKFISGGAPLSRKLGYFFELCGFVILEGYGLTETSAPTHVNRPGRNRIGTVGEAFPGVQVKIAEDGEVLLKGPQIMKGYWRMPEETESVFEDGWLKTGDIGEVDSEGYLRITDRKKDLMKTSGGKYIAPQELENALKSEPLVSQVLIHGDRRKFVSALITLSEENVRRFAAEKGIAFGGYAELTRHPEVRARVRAAVDALNAVQPTYASIKKYAILDHDWSQATGELTPSLKVKRKLVTDKYRRLLDGFYEGERFE